MPLPATADEVWEHIEAWPFAVLGFTSPAGEARAAGVMYAVWDRALHVVTGRDTWKVRHIRANPHVSMTVIVQRLPIRIKKAPPAVITFSGMATVLDLDDLDDDIRTTLTRGIDGVPGDMCAIRITPVGRFVTYGVGVPLMKMRHPTEALARIPVE